MFYKECFFPHLASVRLKIHSKYTLLAESHTNFSHLSKQLIVSDIKIPFLDLLIVQSVLLLAVFTVYISIS